MPAKTNQLERIFNTLDGDIITVVTKTRASVDVSWQDATITDTRIFDASDIPESLENGDTVLKPHTYGLWSALAQRSSDGKSIAEKLEMMTAHWENWEANHKWKVTAVRKASNGSDTYLLAALMQLKGLTLSQATEAVKGLTREQVSQLRANPQVAAIIEQEKAQALDSDALSDLLGGDDSNE